MKRFSNWLNICNGIKYLFYPIAFFLLTIFIIVLAFSPILSTVVSAANSVILSAPLDFEKDVDNVFKIVDVSETPKETILNTDIDFPSYGDKFAQIIIPSISVDAPLYNGSDPKQLRSGVGLYPGGCLPGRGGTILLSAHNHTYFRNLKNLKEGDLIEIRTSYGIYIYEMTGSKSTDKDDETAYDFDKREENLVMYTCINWSSVGATPYRLFVYAKYISGPVWVFD